ncbi:hypothetical protein Gotri_005978 [Gossypium trilobum]|nr:hypothetical protein [Gossypium trilobum]
MDVKPTTIANCFRHCKIRSEEDMPLNKKLILNYPSEKEPLVESPIDEEIIQGVMDVPTDDEQDLDDSTVLPYVSSK